MNHTGATAAVSATWLYPQLFAWSEKIAGMAGMSRRRHAGTRNFQFRMLTIANANVKSEPHTHPKTLPARRKARCPIGTSRH
eukprot:2022870-Prymnesium_polylepis.1